ncbi:winged helix family two component transcriptional regulator [Halospina denitrificans]|uniref:Winged helix family two component transcriptional regulator n=1 Tax=Halospina denitrificans TaxID=332522 RepID=A0A4R7JUE0_9GAMM|nr:response regulator [Halospina denitrificans]TDT41456.1 winged helix family two component transcriptional regulator [Halospina denitrificans]
MHVLLIEDDELVASGLVSGLEMDAFVVDWVTNARSAENAIATMDTDIVILDLGLPDVDGLELLRQWRARGVTVPILVLTARDAMEDRVTGLESGADDYVLKPFDLDELSARLRALRRRASGQSSPAIDHGGLRFLPAQSEVTLNGVPISLSSKELLLLEKFLRAGNSLLTEEQLKDAIYGMDTEIGSNALNVHIHHLRRKLGRDLIQTVRGMGYRLGPPPGDVAREQQ